MKKILNFEGEKYELKTESIINQQQIAKMLPSVMLCVFTSAIDDPYKGPTSKGYYLGVLHMCESYFSHVLINGTHDIVEYSAAKEAARLLIKKVIQCAPA